MDELKEIDAEVKAGRVLSSKNEADIAKIADLSGQVAALARGILDQNAPKEPAPAPAPAAPKPAPNAPAAPGAASFEVSYPKGQNTITMTTTGVARAISEVEERINEETIENADADVDEVIDESTSIETDEPEVYLIDEADLDAVLAQFGLDAQDQGEPKSETEE